MKALIRNTEVTRSLTQINDCPEKLDIRKDRNVLRLEELKRFGRLCRGLVWPKLLAAISQSLNRACFHIRILVPKVL